MVDRSEQLHTVVRPSDTIQRSVSGETQEWMLQESESRQGEELERFRENQLIGARPLGAVSPVTEESLDAGLRESFLGLQGIRTSAQDLRDSCRASREASDT